MLNVLLADGVRTLIADWVSATVAAGLHAVAAAVHFAVAVVLSPVLWLVQQAGASLVVCLLFTLVVTGGIVGWQGRLHLSRLQCGVIAVLAVACFAAVRLFDLDGRHDEAMRVLVAFLAFAVLCYLDVRRFNPAITPSAMALDVASAFVVVLPLFPCLVVVCSTVLFFVVSVFETVGLDTTVLNPVVYVGTCTSALAARLRWPASGHPPRLLPCLVLSFHVVPAVYGPFGMVYYEAKKRAVRNDCLPLSAAGAVRSRWGGVPAKASR